MGSRTSEVLMSSVWPNTWTSSGLWPDHNCTPVWPMFAATDNTKKKRLKLNACYPARTLFRCSMNLNQQVRGAGQDSRVVRARQGEVGCFSSRRQIALRKKKPLEQLVDRYGSTSQSEA